MLHFEMYFALQRRTLFQKYLEPVKFLAVLTSKCALQHNGMYFFDMSIPKSGPMLVYFMIRVNNVYFFHLAR